MLKNIWCDSQSKLSKKDLIKALSEHIDDRSLTILGKDDEDRMVDTMVDAFLDDPLFRWFANAPDANAEREQELVVDLCKWMFPGTLKHNSSGRLGVALGVQLEDEEFQNDGKASSLTPETVMAGAIAITPSSCDSPSNLDWTFHILQNGLPPCYTKKGFGPFATKRLESSFILDDKRRAIMKNHEKHLYLLQVGVRKRFQGKGIGGKLMCALFNTADSLGVPVYLETESIENESLYKRYEFQTVDTVTLSAKGDTSKDANFVMYLMVRYPKNTKLAD